jgi:flagellar motor switch protein FliN/FliY
MSSSQNSSFSSDAITPALVAALNDVVCQVDVVLGSSTLSVRECLRLRRNSIIRLAETAGEDMHVVVNGIAIAAGEVVIIDDSTAIRLTDILPPPSSESPE